MFGLKLVVVHAGIVKVAGLPGNAAFFRLFVLQVFVNGAHGLPSFVTQYRKLPPAGLACRNWVIGNPVSINIAKKIVLWPGCCVEYSVVIWGEKALIHTNQYSTKGCAAFYKK